MKRLIRTNSIRLPEWLKPQIKLWVFLLVTSGIEAQNMNQYNSTMYNQTIYIGNGSGGAAAGTGLVPVTPGISPAQVVAPQQVTGVANPAMSPQVMVTPGNPYGAMVYPGMVPMASPMGMQPMMMGMNPMMNPQQMQAALLMQQMQQQQSMGFNPQGMMGYPAGVGMNPALAAQGMNPFSAMQAQQQELQLRTMAMQLIHSNPETKRSYESMEKAEQDQMLAMVSKMISSMQNNNNQDDDEDEDEEQPNDSMYPYSQMMQGAGAGYGYFPQEDDDEDEEEEEEQNPMLGMMEQFMKNMLVPEKEVFEALDARIADEEAQDKILKQKSTLVPECTNCECCKGYPYNCEGAICKELGSCHCYMHHEKEEERKLGDKYFQEKESCPCCRGYIYGCKGPHCMQKGICFCSAQ